MPLALRLSEGLGLNAICLLKHEYSKDKLDGCAGERSNDCRRPRKSQRKASNAEKGTASPVRAQPVKRLKREVAAANNEQHGGEEPFDAKYVHTVCDGAAGKKPESTLGCETPECVSGGVLA